MEVVSAAVPGGENVRPQPGARIGQRLDRLVAVARLEQPPDQIVPAEPARHPGGPSAGEHDLAAGLVQLLGDLASGLAAAHDQDRAGR